MKAIISRFLAHPRWVMAVAILIPAFLWGYALYFTAARIGQPFEGFVHSAAGKVSVNTPTD